MISNFRILLSLIVVLTIGTVIYYPYLTREGNYKSLYKKAVELIDIKEYDAALALLNKSIVLNPQYGDAYISKASILVLIDRNDESIALLKQVIAQNPNLIEAYVMLTSIYSLQGKWDEMNLYANLTLQYDPNNLYAYFYKAMYLEIDGQYKYALSLLDEALNRNHHNINSKSFYQTYSFIAIMNKSFDKAERALKRLLRLDHKDIKAYYKLATIEQSIHNNENKAKYYLNVGRKLDKNFPTHQDLINNIY